MEAILERIHSYCSEGLSNISGLTPLLRWQKYTNFPILLCSFNPSGNSGSSQGEQSDAHWCWALSWCSWWGLLGQILQKIWQCKKEENLYIFSNRNSVLNFLSIWSVPGWKTMLCFYSGSTMNKFNQMIHIFCEFFVFLKPLSLLMSCMYAQKQYNPVCSQRRCSKN